MSVKSFNKSFNKSCKSKFFVLILFWGAVLSLGACVPITPNYRDYTSNMTANDAMMKAQDVLKTQQWTIKPSPIAPMIATEEREIRNFGVYKIIVSLELVQLNRENIRLFVHAYRKYKLSGTKAKIPYLERHVRQDVVKPLTDALKRQDISVVSVRQML